MYPSRIAFLAPALILASCSQEQERSLEQPQQSGQTELLASASLMHVDGADGGTATLVADGGVVSLKIEATGMKQQGVHGYHLHETGTCDSPDFKSAGGHLNPLGKSHGTLSPDGSHLGDLPNLEVDANGNGSLTASLNGTQPDILNWIFDEDGTAVMIHAGPDDYRTDPSGDAGARIACGVLTRI